MLEDKDLLSIQQARTLVERADQAEHAFKGFTQEQVDKIVAAMAKAAGENAGRLAQLAVEETGRGNVKDKTLKNLFAAVDVFNYLKDLKTCGVIREDKQRRVVEIGVPVGVIAVIVPTTNPTSTTIFKILSALKGRNTVVISPHPQAVRSTAETARVMYEAARKAGAPEFCVNWMDAVSLEGTTELMQHRKTRLILATGGIGLVRAAYSSGKPAYGVGPGNVPAFVERTADVPKAVRDILTGKTFDNGMLCSSEQTLVCDRPIESEVLDELKKNHAYLLNESEQAKLESLVQTADGRLNADIVGKSAPDIARMAGLEVPGDTVCLVGRIGGVGREYPLSMEKLSPILAFYVVDGWEEGCERCIQILEYGGLGHTLSIHSRDQRVILEFGLKKPAHRICVNTPATHGSVGLTTGLPPSMTLGCGGPGGNISSDNITPLHLINVRRLAFEVRRAEDIRLDPAAQGSTQPAAAFSAAPLPRPVETKGAGDRELRDIVRNVVQEYLSGTQKAPVTSGGGSAARDSGPSTDAAASTKAQEPAEEPPVDFVCEEDVRGALATNRKIRVSSRTIITPSALDLSRERDVFTWV